MACPIPFAAPLTTATFLSRRTSPPSVLSWSRRLPRRVHRLLAARSLSTGHCPVGELELLHRRAVHLRQRLFQRAHAVGLGEDLDAPRALPALLPQDPDELVDRPRALSGQAPTEDGVGIPVADLLGVAVVQFDA